MLFMVNCHEEVSTKFTVESPTKERLKVWLEEHGADVVSKLTMRQTVEAREFYLEEQPSGAEFSTERKE